jgi:hypothetical protein
MVGRDPVAATVRLNLLERLGRQAAQGESGDRSPHSKELSRVGQQEESDGTMESLA